MPPAEQYHCRLCTDNVCEFPHVSANFTDVTEASPDSAHPPEPTAFTGAVVVSDVADITEGGEPRIKIYLNWDGQDHFHHLELASDGLRYLAELLARAYGVKLPSDVSDLQRDYHAGTPEAVERAWHELNRRGVPMPDWREER